MVKPSTGHWSECFHRHSAAIASCLSREGNASHAAPGDPWHRTRDDALLHVISDE